MACELYAHRLNGPHRHVRRTSTPCSCKRPSSRRCDFRLSNGRTCDAPLCSGCTVSVGPNVDYCRAHPLPQDLLRLSP